MKMSLILLMAATLSSQGAQIHLALSPPGSSPGVGLSPSNEVPVVTNSAGSGNAILGGIVFDMDTSTLHLAVGYGSAAGFTDLTGVPVAMHIHGPAPVGENATVLTNLLPFNVGASNPALGGTIIADLVFPTNWVSNLLAGLTYVNIHTALNPGGEIRGQLIVVVATNGPPSITCPTNSTAECATIATATAVVSDPDGDALKVVWSVNGAAMQTNSVATGAPSAATSLSFSAFLPLGTNLLTITATDTFGNSVSCSAIVTVVDTTPPVIVSESANPNVLWPPNHRMVPIQVRAQVTDTCGPATWKIISVHSNEAADAQGSGHTAVDWQITADHTLKLRAERSGKGSGRVYTITIQAKDASGNTAQKDLTVSVPHDQSNHGNHGSGNAAKANHNSHNPPPPARPHRPKGG